MRTCQPVSAALSAGFAGTGGVVAGFHVDGFWAAFWGAIWLGIISWAINAIGLRAALQKA